MSAAVLREAAALMRERASRAIPSPWHVDRRDDGRAWICETAGDGREVQTLAMHGFPSTAVHIASWHPAVALAVADWLEDLAWLMDFGDPGGVRNIEHSLTVATTYLGSAS